MGLLDILNGMQNGPRGPKEPGAGGGMSPMTMAILAMLAYKAVKSFTGQAAPAPSGGGRPTPQVPGPNPQNPTTASMDSGGLGDLLPGGLGGLLPGGAARDASAGGAGNAPGGLGDLGGLLRGGLGGLLAGGAAGSVISGGLNEILRQFQQAGHGDTANSWVGTGPNQPISPNAIEDSLGGDLLRDLSQQTGLSIDDLKSGFARELPDLIDQLTPHGRVPTAQELDR